LRVLFQPQFVYPDKDGSFLQNEAFSAIKRKRYGTQIQDDRTPLASNPENDPLRDAADYAQGIQRSGGGGKQEESSQGRSEREALVDWAKENGLLISKRPATPLPCAPKPRQRVHSATAGQSRTLCRPCRHPEVSSWNCDFRQSKMNKVSQRHTNIEDIIA